MSLLEKKPISTRSSVLSTKCRRSNGTSIAILMVGLMHEHKVSSRVHWSFQTICQRTLNRPNYFPREINSQQRAATALNRGILVWMYVKCT